MLVNPSMKKCPVVKNITLGKRSPGWDHEKYRECGII
jgi:hypothetical protein